MGRVSQTEEEGGWSAFRLANTLLLLGFFMSKHTLASTEKLWTRRLERGRRLLSIFSQFPLSGGLLSADGRLSNVPQRGCNKTSREQRLQSRNNKSSRPGNLQLGKLILLFLDETKGYFALLLSLVVSMLAVSKCIMGKPERQRQQDQCWQCHDFVHLLIWAFTASDRQHLM